MVTSCNDKGTYTTIQWDVKQDELLGKKEWQKSVAGITENGSFELHHKPQ